MGDRTHLTATCAATSVLGTQLAAARRRSGRTAADVAARVGVTRQTLRRVERGDPTVAIGTVFDVAHVLGVPLFGATDAELADLAARGERELALLPSRVDVTPPEVDDDF
jgi:transcriptional regulator with XRE-family HTH domain